MPVVFEEVLALNVADGHDGRVPRAELHLDALAVVLCVDVDVIERSLQALVAVGLLREDGSVLEIPSYREDASQYRPTSTSAERMARKRKRDQSGRPSKTGQNGQHVTRSDARDVTCDARSDGAAVTSDGQKKKEKKKEKQNPPQAPPPGGDVRALFDVVLDACAENSGLRLSPERRATLADTELRPFVALCDQAVGGMDAVQRALEWLQAPGNWPTKLTQPSQLVDWFPKVTARMKAGPVVRALPKAVDDGPEYRPLEDPAKDIPKGFKSARMPGRGGAKA